LVSNGSGKHVRASKVFCADNIGRFGRRKTVSKMQRIFDAG
jgi:hypothetical protein